MRVLRGKLSGARGSGSGSEAGPGGGRDTGPGVHGLCAEAAGSAEAHRSLMNTA